GYTLPIEELTPRLYFEFDYASGDNRAGGSVGTFNQLYPNGHAYLGYIDFIGRQNIISPSAGVSLVPVRDLTLSLQQYLFWRASDRDAVYNKSGGVLRAGAASRARYIGAETDLLATYNFTRHLQGYAGYSFFASGGFIDKTGPDRNSNFFYGALQYTFSARRRRGAASPRCRPSWRRFATWSSPRPASAFASCRRKTPGSHEAIRALLRFRKNATEGSPWRAINFSRSAVF